jgi:3-deoxy-D-manno-octulosonic-acid transferase
MKRLYDIVFTCLFLLASPYYFFRLRRRGNWRENFSQRFGRFSSKVKQAVTNRHVMWIHAVSVGEVNLATQLIKAVEARMPNLKIVVSTTTTTGMGELNKKLPSHILKIYYPIDRWFYVNKAIMAIHPEVIVLVEAEVWPNFLWRAQELRIPAFLVNARLSNRSFRRYRRYGFLFRPLFEAFKGVGCQSEDDAARLRELGCRPETIRVVGSLKFDAAHIEERRVLNVRLLLDQIGVPRTARLLVAGSTHAGEEAILGDIYLRLRQQHPDLFLVVVPRHFERGKEAGRDLAAKGVRFIYRSEITGNTSQPAGSYDALLVNTTGELRYFYEEAALIFVGKSLTAEGGQNPIEPGALGKTMVFGPNMQNFEAIARNFVEQQGAVQVRDAAELESALAALLHDPRRCAELGGNARRVVQQNQGAIERTVEMFVESLGGTDIYVAKKEDKEAL